MTMAMQARSSISGGRASDRTRRHHGADGDAARERDDAVPVRQEERIGDAADDECERGEIDRHQYPIANMTMRISPKNAATPRIRLPNVPIRSEERRVGKEC